MNGDTPVSRRLFIEMAPQEQSAYVQLLQERRLRVVRSYQQVQKEREEAALAKTKETLDKQSRMMQRDIDTAERAMSKVEDRMNKLSALRAMIAGGLA